MGSLGASLCGAGTVFSRWFNRSLGLSVDLFSVQHITARPRRIRTEILCSSYPVGSKMVWVWVHWYPAVSARLMLSACSPFIQKENILSEPLICWVPFARLSGPIAGSQSGLIFPCVIPWRASNSGGGSQTGCSHCHKLRAARWMLHGFYQSHPTSASVEKRQ